MKFEELPDIPKDWIHFNAGVHPELPLTTLQDNRQFLRTQQDRIRENASRDGNFISLLLDGEKGHSDRKLKNIQRLQKPETVLVVANIEADLFGGTFSQFLKCLTAVKLCEVLAEYAVDAVPVCWICRPADVTPLPQKLFRILDAETGLHRLRVQMDEFILTSSGKERNFSRIPELIAWIEDIGRDSFDPEIIATLKKVYSQDTGWSTACSRFLAVLMDAWGMFVVDAQSPDFQSALREAGHVLSTQKVNPDGFFKGTPPVYLMQSSIFPVFACVLDPYELKSFTKALTAYKIHGLTPPISWPASSATFIDSRNGRILKNYKLRFQDLFTGEENLLKGIKGRIPRSSITAKLNALKSEVEKCMDAFSDQIQEDDGFRKAKKSCLKRVVFQLDKMSNRINAAGMRKESVARRQIHRVACSLLPDGLIQEYGLSGLSLLLRYSHTLFASLHERLDIMKFEHQLIYME
ncbi:MAG: bacillithiol biosynthesis BshC [Acidobacteriota bacterium]